MQRIALVTGASRGLGYAVARALGQNGSHVLAIARTIGGLEELDEEIKSGGGSATLVPLDITDDVALRNMGKSIHDRWGKLDLFVHCAAQASPFSPAGHIDEKEISRAMKVNAVATQRLIAMLDPLLKTADGSQAILTTHAEFPVKFSGAYRGSKAAASAIWDSWREESIQTGPRVGFFEPDPMPTALRARFFPGEDRSSLSSCAQQAAQLLEKFDL